MPFNRKRDLENEISFSVFYFPGLETIFETISGILMLVAQFRAPPPFPYHFDWVIIYFSGNTELKHETSLFWPFLRY